MALIHCLRMAAADPGGRYAPLLRTVRDDDHAPREGDPRGAPHRGCRAARAPLIPRAARGCEARASRGRTSPAAGPAGHGARAEAAVGATASRGPAALRG